MARTARGSMARVAAVLGVAVPLLVLFATATAAQSGSLTSSTLWDGSVPPRVNAVDASGDTLEVTVLWSATEELPSEVTLTDDGEASVAEAVRASEIGRSAEIMVVLESTARAASSGAEEAFEASLAETADLFDGPELALGAVAATDSPVVASRLLASEIRGFAAMVPSLTSVEPSGSVALYDAVELATEAFGEAEGVTRTVVVLTGGPDQASSDGALSRAEAGLLQSGAQLLVIPYGEIDPALAQLAEQSGGAVVGQPGGTTSGREIARSVQLAAGLSSDRLVVTAPAVGEGERRDALLALDESTLAFSYPDGLAINNPWQLAPIEVPTVPEPGFFAQPAVLYVSMALAFVAIATAVWSLGGIFAGQSSLDSLLARYSTKDEELEEEEVGELLVQTAVLKRAVDITERFAERQGVLQRAEVLLERADLPVRAAEAMFFLGSLSVVVLGVATIFTGNPLIGLVLALIAAFGSYTVVSFIAKRRLKAFRAQLPDTLGLLAGTLRAGYSLSQGLDAVANEIADPMGNELRRAITEAQLGREIEEALLNVAERLDSPDFEWVVMAIGIQREVGGNLAEVLLSVADTMVQRERLKREVDALTAEGRVSAAILALLPPGLGLVMWLMNPSYIEILFTRQAGLVLLGLAVTSGMIGLFWMKKVITVDA